jgi:hypothetical protein
MVRASLHPHQRRIIGINRGKSLQIPACLITRATRLRLRCQREQQIAIAGRAHERFFEYPHPVLLLTVIDQRESEKIRQFRATGTVLRPLQQCYRIRLALLSNQ